VGNTQAPNGVVAYSLIAVDASGHYR